MTSGEYQLTLENLSTLVRQAHASVVAGDVRSAAFRLKVILQYIDIKQRECAGGAADDHQAAHNDHQGQPRRL